MAPRVGTLLGLVVLSVALFSGTVDLHAPTHQEMPSVTTVDLGATHAGETGHVESAGDSDDLLCQACLALVESVGGCRPDAQAGARLEGDSVLGISDSSLPRVGSRGAATSRAPPASLV